ncbi:malonate decarboxylase subunit epsilon [Cupriavidus taiwanensis]|uniref:Malonyl CoA-acyl carrier protein transacylase n=1 Tax=Cupriavidus taiwanensis TaxID=164546 RepID=A0A375IEU4_9BURK|nr:malonate decarboxylase subunit epsilon [Cupriavidus taiwanensis]SOY42521.1 Malonyl CoA-acyl carrier protein transacylase [Cupriavidus taiwanensis]SOY58690.1 Malonyl CoA-acyl carrier protein transacylase [Cupriavidus taiwanensis]SOY79993.1 Malonyl CoA-acyl carrier protein transacylase [Cupriavidus taiwanensis]SOZ26440.1 Malonyl CoA-acyl carrier protein transacylase [Cupriavidus taiwanensis]SOZ50466.1 Malonyl CoA-acyl carrier protein transacylase [Cupriavidus taiwanensis]
MQVLITFPGQGTQRPGMLKHLPADPAVTAVLAEAEEVLQVPVAGMDTAERLQSTVWTQLCLLTSGVAMARCLAAHDANADAVAGLSIGAYAAAVTAGVLSFADALRLVRLRGELMAQAYPRGYGMTAILGLDRNRLAPLVAQVCSPQRPVYLANFNAPTQIVIAGSEAAMAEVSALARAAGAQAAKPVAIHVPSHCALLDAAAHALQQAMQDVALCAPSLRYFSASKARELRDPRRIADDLALNMATPVRWHETMQLAHANGARLVVEAPPGDVLTRLAQPVFADGITLTCDRARLDSIVAIVKRHALN